MDVSVVWDVLKDNVIIIGVTASIILGVSGLWYKIKHDRDERHRKDKEFQANVCNALKQMYKELDDTLNAIESREGEYEYIKDGKSVRFLKLRFHYTECENLIKSSEIRSTNINTNEIKDVISIIKNNNRVFHWMETNLPPKNYDGSAPCVNNGAYPEMSHNVGDVCAYHRQLQENIPHILEEIKRELG